MRLRPDNRARRGTPAGRTNPRKSVALAHDYKAVLQSDEDGGWDWSVENHRGEVVEEGFGEPSRKSALREAKLAARDLWAIEKAASRRARQNPCAPVAPMQVAVVHVSRVDGEPYGDWAVSPEPASLQDVMRYARVYDIEGREDLSGQGCPWWQSQVRSMGGEPTVYTLHVRQADGAELNPEDAAEIDALIAQQRRPLTTEKRASTSRSDDLRSKTHRKTLRRAMRI